MKVMQRRVLFVCFLAVALLGTACSESADSGQSSGGESSKSSERTASDIGVTADKITVAYLDPDVKKLVEAGIVEDIFPGPEAFNGLVDAVNKDGGINGRQLEVKRYSFDTVKVPAGLIAACTQVTEDDKNFLAFSVSFFGDGASCIAVDHSMPLLTGSGMAGTLYDPASKNMFLYNLTFEEAQVALVKSLETSGDLKSAKKIGVVIRDEPGGLDAVNRGIKPALAAAGFKDVEVAIITGSSMGDPAALSAAAQRFKADGVDSVVLLANMFVAGGFMTAAQQEGLKATFYTSDQSEAASNLIVKFGPPEMLAGAKGVSWKRLSGTGAATASDVDKACVSKSAGAANLKPGTAAYDGFANLCLMFETMVKALRDAGDNPTRTEFVSAMEGLGEFPMGSGAMGSFGKGKHTAPNQVRPIKFDSSCSCWVPTGDFVTFR